jgi:thiamine thiazole synthase
MTTTFDEVQISQLLVSSYYQKLQSHLVSDVLIVGAGPAGLMAAYYLSQQKLKVTILEKRLSPGGGIWGGGMAMNQIVVQEQAVGLLREFGIRYVSNGQGLYSVDAIEMACGLCFKAVQSGVTLLNLITVEDVCLRDNRVGGLVVNRSLISGVLPVDPIMFSAKAVVDVTGHEAVVVETVRKRGLLPGVLPSKRGEGPMDPMAGEEFVVQNVSEVYPGLWIAGMSVCATLGGPRMGPIFGGMLLSGQRVAELIGSKLKGEIS